MSEPASTAFTLVRPTRERPIVVEVPHAGLAVPDDVRASLRVSPGELLRDADPFVDRIWANAPRHGASLLVAHISRYVIDLNRAPDDVGHDLVPDHPAPRPAQGRGVLWRATLDGRDALVRPLSYAALEARLARYHAPYHDALDRELERKRALRPRVLLVAAHSMPSRARGGPPRADVVPGTLGGTSAAPELRDAVEAHFRAEGLSVRHDDPYRGGYTTARCGRPRDGVHAIQIELNRGLYLHEPTSRPDEAAIDRLSACVGRLLDRLATLV